MIFGGAIQMDPGETVLFLLMAVGLPALAVVAVTIVLVRLVRPSRSRRPPPFPPVDQPSVEPWTESQRRTAAIVVGLCGLGALLLYLYR